MKIIILLGIYLIVLQSCTNPDPTNEKMLARIDDLDFTSKRLKVELSFNQLPIAIEEVTWYKKDANGKVVYSQVERSSDTSKQYYWEDGDLLYRERTALSGEYKTIYQTIRNRVGEVEKAMRITTILPRKADTVVMDYDYEIYENGTKKRVTIITEGEKYSGKGISWYAPSKKCTYEIQMMNGDTVSETVYEYKNDQLLKKTMIVEEQSFEQKVTIEYNDNELPIRTESYTRAEGWGKDGQDDVSEEEVWSVYGANDLIIKEIIIDQISGDTTWYRFEYIDLSS